MTKDEGLFDRVLTAYVTRVSGRTVALTALLLYPVLGLGVPLALNWSTPNLVSINLIGVAFAALITLGWLFVRLEASHRRHLVDWTTNLRLLTAEEFEWLVGELYRREGWKVRETGSQDGPDGNIDLELTKGRERRLIQCKRWTSRRAGVNVIRAFAGTLLREGIGGAHGDFVTLSSFTEQARQEGAKMGMTLVDGRDLYQRLENARRAEPCPACQSPMALDRSRHGWWFRCTTNGCSGKRNLGADPGRAVDLLTEPPLQPAAPASQD